MTTPDWKDTFTRWSKPPSDTEENKAARAADMIRSAIKDCAALSKNTIEVYATGSFRNNTNVPTESDIDVAVVCHGSFFYRLPPGQTATAFGFSTPAAYDFGQFRNDLEGPLRETFGSAMNPTDKTFDVPENSYRMEADVTPFFEYRHYTGARRADSQWAYHEGVMSQSRSGQTFVNWHVDHYREGVARNEQTRRRFKYVTHIFEEHPA